MGYTPHLVKRHSLHTPLSSSSKKTRVTLWCRSFQPHGADPLPPCFYGCSCAHPAAPVMVVLSVRCDCLAPAAARRSTQPLPVVFAHLRARPDTHPSAPMKKSGLLCLRLASRSRRFAPHMPAPDEFRGLASSPRWL